MKMTCNSYIIGIDDGNILLRGGEGTKVLALADEKTSRVPVLFSSPKRARNAIRLTSNFRFTPSANSYRDSIKELQGDPRSWLKAIPCTITIDT